MKGVRTIGPEGLERNLGERAKVVWPKTKQGIDRSKHWGVIVENPLTYEQVQGWDDHADYAVKLRLGPGRRVVKHVPIEHGTNVAIQTANRGGAVVYTFLDDSD